MDTRPIYDPTVSRWAYLTSMLAHYAKASVFFINSTTSSSTTRHSKSAVKMETAEESRDSTINETSFSVSAESHHTVSSNRNEDSNESNSQEHESKTNTDDEINNRSNDALAKGLSTVLSNVIRDFDSKAQETFKSQDKLNSAIDRLTGELDQLLEDAPLPFILQHAAKISGVRKRVSSLNSLLKSIQRRIDNMDRMLSVGVVQERSNSGSS